MKVRIKVSKTIALVVLLQLCAVANFSLFTFHFSLLHAQGLPLIRNYTAVEYGGHNRNYDIEIGEDGTVFVANFEGLLYYDRARWRMIHTANNRRVTVIYRDSRNTVWVGGYNFMARLQKRANGELFLQQFSEEGQFSGEVMEIFEEGGALLFVAGDNNIYEVGGFVEGGKRNEESGKSLPTISLKKKTNANFQPGVESDIVSLEALEAGAENVIKEGITQTEKLDGGLQVKVKRNGGLIIADSDGRDMYSITEDNGLCSNQVSYVAYDGHGVLWGATGNGIFAIELPSVYSYFLPKDGLTGRVHTITAYNGKIYVGDTNGLYVVDSWQYKRIAGINNICWELCPSPDGLLAATSSGIYKVTANGSVSRLTSSATTALMVDGDKVYAGEPDGVVVYTMDHGKWVMDNGRRVSDLPLVTEIRKDGRGGLRLKTVHGEGEGVSRKEESGKWKEERWERKEESGKRKENTTEADFNREMGDSGFQKAYLFAAVRDIKVKAQYRHGSQVWIGGNEILAVIDTDKKDIERLSDCRTIRFCSITMGNDSVLWGGYGYMPKKLQRLDSDEGNLHFFYALHYAPLTGKTLYRYRLSNQGFMGGKGEWSAWSEKQDVAFLNLPYGSFVLSVQARLPNGELSDVASVGFSIAFPLLMRWYMVAVYFIGFACLVWLMFRYRLKKLQQDKIKLEQIVEERTADLRNAQHELIRQEKMASVGKLTEGLIDRILNPMNFIIYFSKMANDLSKDIKENIDNNKDGINKDDYEDTQEVFDHLTEVLQNIDQYGRNTTRTLKAMEEVLKDRTGGYMDMDLRPVLQLCERMMGQQFGKEIEQYHIQTEFSLPNEAMMLYGNPDMLSKAVMNLLGNAVYAVVKKVQRQLPLLSRRGQGWSDLPPRISLSADVRDGRYVVKIRDNGIGIEEKVIGKVFDPFFTTKTTDEGAGVGLYLSREIIQNHKGDISVASVKEEYTEFTITL